MQQLFLLFTSVAPVVSFSSEPHISLQNVHTGDEGKGVVEAPMPQVPSNVSTARSAEHVHVDIGVEDFQAVPAAATEQLSQAAKTLAAQAPMDIRQAEMKRQNEEYLKRAVEAYRAKPKAPKRYIGGGSDVLRPQHSLSQDQDESSDRQLVAKRLSDKDQQEHGQQYSSGGELQSRHGGRWGKKTEEEKKLDAEEKEEKKTKKLKCKKEQRMKKERKREFKRRRKKGDEPTKEEEEAPYIDDEDNEELDECLGRWDKTKVAAKKAGNAVADAIGIAIQAYALLNGGFCPEEGLPGAAALIEPQWAFGMGCMYRKSCMCPPMYGFRDLYECANMPLWGELPTGWGAPFVMIFGFCRIPLWMFAMPIIMFCCYCCCAICFYCKRKMNQEDEEAEWAVEEAQAQYEAGVY